MMSAPASSKEALASASTSNKKRKRFSPFRIKVGCVVALRYKPSTGNHVTIIVPAPPEQTKPSKHALHCLVGTDSHVEVWTDPIPGRDEGLALIGRRVRCCFTREIKLETNGSHSSNNGVNENGKHPGSKKTKNFILEAEVVSILGYGTTEGVKDQERGRRNRETSASGTEVELLIDRDMLDSIPFLERTDEDVDVNELKKESARRAYNNEEAIKGENKVTVKVKLADASGIPTNTASSQKDVAKWAIRKRLPNEPGQPLFEIQSNGIAVGGAAADKANGTKNGTEKASDGPDKAEGNTGGDGKAASIPPAKKSRKVNGSKNAPTPPTQFMGNRNDDPAQQQKNWRWFAARFYDMYLYLSATEQATDPATTICNRNSIQFLEYYSELLASCGGFVGEVLEVTPSSRGGTLAMVTVRRLILPEHTASGRSSVYNQQKGCLEVYDDYDSTLVGRRKNLGSNDDKMDAENGSHVNKSDGLSSVVFRVPIEELVIVSRQVKRDFENQPQGQNPPNEKRLDELVVASSYSWKADCLVPLKNMVPKRLDGEHLVPRPLTKKKLNKVSLCHRCRTWLPRKQVTICENMDCSALRSLSGSTEVEGEDASGSLGWCKSCLDTLRGIESIIDQDFSTDTVQSMGDLPCCLRLCDCRRCHTLVDQLKTEEAVTEALENAHANNSNRASSDDQPDANADVDNSLFRDTESMLKSMPSCDFDVPSGFIDLKRLPASGSKPVTKTTKPPAKKGTKTNPTAAKSTTGKRKRDTPSNKAASKKPKASISRPRTPPPMSVVPQRAGRRTSEDYSVFKPSCSRLMDYEAITVAKIIRNADDEERVLSGRLVAGDKPRNLREVMEKKARQDAGKKEVKDEKVLSSRAARANQRRLVKDVALLGASSFNLDTLAGRESQLRFDRSGIHAWGVFADGEISAGDMIIEYRGEIIGNAMAEKREREYEAAKIGSDYMFRMDGLTVCDATKQGNVARFINASCDPNCYTKIITLDGKQRIVIYAKKDIKVGEELCYDYKFSLEYDDSRRIPCCCGSPECKGFMNWDKKMG